MRRPRESRATTSGSLTASPRRTRSALQHAAGRGSLGFFDWRARVQCVEGSFEMDFEDSILKFSRHELIGLADLVENRKALPADPDVVR